MILVVRVFNLEAVCDTDRETVMKNWVCKEARSFFKGRFSCELDFHESGNEEHLLLFSTRRKLVHRFPLPMRQEREIRWSVVYLFLRYTTMWNL